LPYLRRASEIAHEDARRHAVLALMEHRDFDAKRESSVIDGLLGDRAALVRGEVMCGLCARNELPLRLRLTKALSFMETDPENEARIAATRGIFALFTRQPPAELEGLLTDPSLAIADRMLAALKDDELGRNIAFRTAALSGIWGRDGEEGRVKVATAWWEDVKKGKVIRQSPPTPKPRPGPIWRRQHAPPQLRGR